MPVTHLSGLYVGTSKDAGDPNNPKNMGPVICAQMAEIAQNGTNPVTVQLNIPKGAQIIDIIWDTLTAFNSATSATGTVGTAAGGSQYAGGVDAKVVGRVRPTFTAAQLAAMSNQSVLGVPALTPSPVYVTVTPSGATSAGFVNVTLVYAVIDY